MVATVLALKFTTVRHQLQREWWRALLLIGGAVWSVTLVPMVWWAQVRLGFEAADVRASIVVLAAAVCIVGWIVVPLMVTGLEDTLDSARFATLGVSATQIAPGLTIAAFLTVPALFFGAMFTLLSGSWRYDGVGARAIAVVGGLLTVAVMVLAARVAVAWSARAINDRRTRGLLLLSMGVGIAVLGSVMWIGLRDGLEAGLEFTVPVVAESLARTPVGAGMYAPAAWVAGDTWGALWRLAMMVAMVVLLGWAWKDSIAHALVHPLHRGGGRRRRADAVLGGVGDGQERSPARWWHSSGPVRAVRARLLVSWATDARYVVAAAGVVALPVLFFAVAMPVLSLETRWAFVAPVLLASSIGWGRHNDVALDSSGLWLDIVSGARGREVMLGRMQATLVWALPAVLIAAVGILAWSGRWADAPGLIGAAVGTLGATMGVSAVCAVALPYRTAGPGENPFGAEVGSLGASFLAQLASAIATAAVLPLMTVPFFLSLTVHSGWGWVAFATGLVLGAVCFTWGARAAGSLFNHRSGKLIAAIT
ncbi:hypothetical protein [Demequina globuliformis]|uniref:hypothetical protein n=1 Tax=Demequina globuliformis TaxID=676202 RepID=UPI0007818DD1|nr:hypothetical protein [Demequina globuliformis]